MENPNQQSQTNQFVEKKMSQIKLLVEKATVGGIQE